MVRVGRLDHGNQANEFFFAGLFQRLMFAVAYAWYARAALEDRKAPPPA